MRFHRNEKSTLLLKKTMSEATELKAYTLADVSSHNNESSCWVVIHGKVYDVTKYLEDHPGGEDVLLGVGGTFIFLLSISFCYLR